MDSGAARSVCPKRFGEQFGLTASAASINGEGFRTATNKRVPNEGSRVVKGKTVSGQPASMHYSVANIAVPLDSVSQICDGGSTAIFEKTGGYILSPTGVKTSFDRSGDTYVRRVWVKREPATKSFFSRPKPTAS